MNYQEIYNKIILKANALNRVKTRKNRTCYYEKHHILPKCLGGDTSPSNLVLLTAKEHYICHRLLCEIYLHSNEIKFAFWAMCNQLDGDVSRDYKIPARVYERAKIEFSKINSKRHSGKTISNKQKDFLSKKWLGDKNPNFGKKGYLNHNFGKHRTDDTLYKISKTKLKHPERNPQFSGYYLTPFGKFYTAPEVVKYLKTSFNVIVSVDVVRFRCKNPDYIVTEKCSNTLLTLTESFSQGKTFKELGWGFEPLFLK